MGEVDTATRRMFERYLSNTDSAEAKINQLLALATRFENDLSRHLKCLQVALVLEKSVQHPCQATLHLNMRMGDLFRDINAAYALYYYERTIAIGSQIHASKYVNRVYNVMAGLYLDMGRPANSLRCYRSALVILDPSDSVMKSSVLNNIGWLFSKTGQADSALSYYDRAMAYYAGKSADDDLYSNILENIAKIEERRGDYRPALQKYTYNVGVYTRLKNGTVYLRNRFNEIRARVALRLPVRDMMDSLHLFIEAQKDRINGNEALTFYRWAAEHAGSHNEGAPAPFVVAHAYWRDLLAEKRIKQAIALANVLLSAQSFSFKSAYDAYRAELISAQAATRTNRLIAILAFVCCALMIGAAALYYTRRKRELLIMRKIAVAEFRAKDLEAKTIKTELENVRLQTEAELRRKELEARYAQSELEKERLLTRNELEMKELEKRAMQNELELKKRDLTQVILLNTQVHETNKEMIERLQKISRGSDPARSIKTLLADLKSRNQLDERLSSLQANIDHLNSGFYQKLKERFPQLTRAEVELCGYILISLSNKDISILKNVEPASVKMSKTRLRKKLGIGPEEDLTTFVKSV